MKINLTKVFVRLTLVLFLFTATANVLNAQRVKKVVVQAFWWDHWNNNFRFKWADYLTELAPRLKALGVDAIWIPPNYKNDGPGSVGYGPFDQYDLGDKNQKGDALSDTVRTRSGTKDELLRMIAVMHANGIEVIQDVVLNHTTGAGNRGGGGGRDYTAASIPYNDATSGFGGTNFYKNFRYVSYGTPHLDTSAADYWTRSGRWSKNIMNFYPNANNTAVNTTDINKTYFGPDMAYESNSIGQSTNIPKTGSVTINGITKSYYNPVQASNYMAQSAKDWIVWYKKQTGADGFRWDAVKHFGFDVQKDLTYALKYQSSFANGGNEMLNIGEWVGSSSEIDYYASQLIKTGTPAESGVPNEQMSAGFDFGLRGYSSSGGIYAMVTGGGGFNMQAIPGAQQSQTYRYFDYPSGKRVYKTVPFVNSHDTYRPILSANGNYSQPLGNSAGWNTSNELGGNGGHIDPREPRFAAANAVIAAVDGNPCFFLEDVFDYFSLNKRWSHLPADVDSLPLRKDIGNIMQCHQKLNFKDGDYAVPTALSGTGISPVYTVGNSGDHLVIERTGKALIGITDAYSPASNNTSDQQVYVTADNAWATGTLLYDYSGAHGVTSSQIYSDHRVLISTAPCGHNIVGALGHGYSIWAPYPLGTPTSVADLYNYIATYNQPRDRTTTQEWEMADDLGDSHCGSLGQGGQLPANSTNQRVAGKIYVQSGTNVAYKIFPQIDNTQVCISLWDLDGNKLSEACGNSTAASPILGSYSTTYTGWITVKVRSAINTQAAQKVWANVTYTAPTTLNTRDAVTSATTRASIWTGNKGTSDITDCGNWEEGKVPTQVSQIVIPTYALPRPLFSNTIAGRTVALAANGTYKNITNSVVKVSGDASVTANSTATGSYNFDNLNTGVYTIKPTKNNDVKKNNGVSSIDVILVTNHILNKIKLNSPYKLIAADVNNNKTITNIDIIFMKRLILGVDTTFTGNRLWAFVDSAHKFVDTTNPFPYKDTIQLNELTRSKANQTFIGVKLGDVNYDWNASLARGKSIDNVELIIDNVEPKIDKQLSIVNYQLPIKVKNFKDLTALQYTLHFDNSKYEFVAVSNNKLAIEYNVQQANQTGNVSFLWADSKGEEKSLEDGSELFTLVLKPKDVRFTMYDVRFNLTNDITEIEAWDKDNQQHNIILSQKTKDQRPTTKDWFSVSPNPNDGNIVVSLSSNTNKTIVFELSNAVGKTLYTQSLEAVKGNNVYRLNLNKNTKLPSGVYFIKAIGMEGENVKRIVVNGK